MPLSENYKPVFPKFIHEILVLQVLMDVTCNEVNTVFITVGTQLSIMYIVSKLGILCVIFPQHSYHRLLFRGHLSDKVPHGLLFRKN